MASAQKDYPTPRRRTTISLQRFVPIKLLPRSPWESPSEEYRVTTFLEMFALIDYRDIYEELIASQEMIELLGMQLMENGVPREIKDSEGRTLLERALRKGNLKFVCILVSTGAFSLFRTTSMQSPLAFAVRGRWTGGNWVHLNDTITLVLILASTGMTTYQPSFQASIMATPPTSFTARCSMHLQDYFYPSSQSVPRLPSLWLRANPLWWSGDPVLTDILIRSGACTNRQVFECWFCFANKKELVDVVRPGLDGAEIKVLEWHSRQVPSLMSLSRLAVSHSIGCGSMWQRAAAIKTLEIPVTLKPYLMFEDLWKTVSESRGSDDSLFFFSASDFL